MPEEIFASDADGCVADMVGGFSDYVMDWHGERFNQADVIYHDRMGESPALVEIDRKLYSNYTGELTGPPGAGIERAFRNFMANPIVYERYIKPIEGSVEAHQTIREQYHVVFVTAMMKGPARSHYRSKMEWLERYFPDSDIVVCTSKLKHRFNARWAVDDKYETVKSWAWAGTPTFLFQQPWNEAPSGHHSYNWKEIASIVCGR